MISSYLKNVPCDILKDVFYFTRMREKGILLSADGPDENVLKLKPPMVITKADVNHFMDMFKDVMYEVS